MAGKIPQAFIDELINRIDIVDIIDSRVPLKKAGRDYTACCPFHNEKTPSFTVSQTKQFYHCFGCGAHGTAIGFLMEYERMGFLEAVEELAALANMEIPHDSTPSSRTDDYQELYEVMERATNYYQRQLRDHPEAQRAIEYLKKRGVSGEIAAAFGIGFAPPGWDGLLSAVGKEEQQRKQLLRNGMIVEKDSSRFYDRFRDRIMFPIRDRRGRTIAFGGRILENSQAQENGKSAATGPKYLNSPETPIFHKGRELYGLFEARKAVRQPKRLLVVEGYMDVVALAQFGIRYAVATLGTATTREHLEMLFRAVPEIIFCFDGDRAGREAAWRALENALPVMRDGRQARFLFLPDGEDPDTLVRKEGQERFEHRLTEALPLSEFLFKTLSARVEMETAEGRASLVAAARPLLEKLPESVFRQMMQERLEKVAGTAIKPLSSAPTGQPSMHDNQLINNTNKPSPKARKGNKSMRMAISLLLNHPSLAQQADNLDELRRLELPGSKILIQLLESLLQQPQLSTAGLLEQWRGTPEEKHLGKLVSEEIPGTEDDLKQVFQDALKKLCHASLEQRHATLHQKGVENLDENEKKEWLQSLMESKRLNDKMNQPGN